MMEEDVFQLHVATPTYASLQGQKGFLSMLVPNRVFFPTGAESLLSLLVQAVENKFPMATK